jgi:hypothetical protein
VAPLNASVGFYELLFFKTRKTNECNVYRKYEFLQFGVVNFIPDSFTISDIFMKTNLTENNFISVSQPSLLQSSLESEEVAVNTIPAIV